MSDKEAIQNSVKDTYNTLTEYFGEVLINKKEFAKKYLLSDELDAKADLFEQANAAAKFAMIAYSKGNILDEVARGIIEKNLGKFENKPDVSHHITSFTNQLDWDLKDKEGKDVFPKTLAEIREKYPAKVEKEKVNEV